jgi:hypothetical protein
LSVTDAQVRKAMEELSKHGGIGLAAMRAGMDPKTARKYAKAGKMPSELKEPRKWRTHADAFVEEWGMITAMLEAAPELEAKTIFEFLETKNPGGHDEGELRTLQRRVRAWRAQHGPEKEVFFAQNHRPGEAGQTDFTWATELGITIGGEPLAHMLCHFVLPYSNWEWATVCHSESMAALRHGVQAAVFQLGRRPYWHQTDHSTAATHKLSATGEHRGFNSKYVLLMDHLGMKPRTTGVGEKEQNGDVEAANGAMKRRLEQHLLLRGSRDFESVAAYEQWLQEVLRKANGRREVKLREEMAVMEPLAVSRLPEHKDVQVGVSPWSTIRVLHNAYSVPSRLIGESVTVRIWEDRLEVFHGGISQLVVERLLGRMGHRINYRHVIWSLVRKPGAFARYRYREDLFPTLTFRRAYDALSLAEAGRGADIEYLRILHLAASTMESEVEVALELLLAAGSVPTAAAVKELSAPEKRAVPMLTPPVVDLTGYDRLLCQAGEEMAR